MAVSNPKTLTAEQLHRYWLQEYAATEDRAIYDRALTISFGPLAAIVLGALDYEYDKARPGTPPATTSDSATIPIAGDTTLEVQFNGTGLGFDSSDAPVGSFTSIDLMLPGVGSVYNLRVPDPVPLKNFVDAAAEGTGPVNYFGYRPAYDLLLRPEQGFDHIYTGQDYDEVIEGFSAGDRVNAAGGDDHILLGDGPDTLDGGAGLDAVDGSVLPRGVEINLAAGTASHAGGSAGLSNIENATGSQFDDRIVGDDGDNVLKGMDGSDTLNGGAGNDRIEGGATEEDRRDVVYAGSGDDSVDGGYGNDLIYGQGGNDTLAGGFGADELQGQDGDDVITGSAFGDIVFGNAGDDFVNGGFGHDLINGGSGADKFFHVGIEGHGSDWIQDYDAAEGDVLLFGIASARADQFQVNTTHTANRETGERSGDDDIEEAFVTYRPTGQIMWALVDGAGQASINLQIGAEVFDLLG